MLNRVANSFIVASRTTLYHLFGQRDDPSKGPHVRSVTEILSRHDLSFVQIQKDAGFERESKKYLDANPSRAAVHLIDVLRSDRTNWALGLQDIRDKIIHDTTYQGLKMLYRPNGNRVAIGFPRLNGIGLVEFVEMFWNNLVDAAEEIVLACVGTRLPPCMAIVPIPEGEWDPKFRIDGGP